MRRGPMRVFAKTIAWIVLTVLALPVVAIGLLQIPAVRTQGLRYGLAWLQESTGYRLTVGRLERLDPWGLRAKNLGLRDPDGASIAELSSLELSLRPASLLHGGLQITHVGLRGGRGWLPESLLRGTQEPSEAPSEEAPQDTTFEIRVDDATLEDVSVSLAYEGVDYQVTVQRLMGAGRWGKVPALSLGVLDVRASDGQGQELLALHTRRGDWDAGHGGNVLLTGELAGAPLALTAHFAPLGNQRDAWPEGNLELTIHDLQRRSMLLLGVPEGAGLVGKQDLELHVSSHAQRVQASVLAAQGSLRADAVLDERHAEATLRVLPVHLARLSMLLPNLTAAGTVWASYYVSEPHPTISATWRGLELDGQAIPDLSLQAEQLGSVLTLRSLSLAGFEQALQLLGSVDTESGAVEAELRLRDFAFDRIPWLKRQGIRGSSNGDLALQLDGRDGFAGQGTLEVDRASYAGASAQRIQLALGLHGKPSAPRGQAELALHGVEAGRVVLHRLSADFDGTMQSVQARLQAHGPDSAFTALLSSARPTAESFELDGSGHGTVAGQPLNLRLRTFVEADTGAYVGDVWLASREQRVRGHGEVDRKGRFQATLETQSLDLATWSRMAGVDGVRGHIESFTRMAGTRERPLGT